MHMHRTIIFINAPKNPSGPAPPLAFSEGYDDDDDTKARLLPSESFE
jgi:hypothetical protein